MLIYLALLDDEQDKIKFADIYNTYNKQMWYAANEILKDKHLAEDAVHDAFLGIAKSFSKIKSRELSEVKAQITPDMITDDIKVSKAVEVVKSNASITKPRKPRAKKTEKVEEATEEVTE